MDPEYLPASEFYKVPALGRVRCKIVRHEFGGLPDR